MQDNQHEQLFTELTPVEAAVIEGGKTFYLYSIEAIKAGADKGGDDDAYLNIGGKKVWSKKMGTGSTSSDLTISESIGKDATISLFDADPWPNRDDLIDSFVVNSTTKKTTKTLEGSGSKYKLTYSIS